MKIVLGCVRRADKDFHMIEPGDHIAVGVSGGKDSLLLLYALYLYRMFSHTEYSLSAFTLTMGLQSGDFSGIQAFCEELAIPYTIKETRIFDILFNIRKETNPCALCAKMRRGILNDLAMASGCGKLALGHHREDVLETLMMSLLYESRLHTFHPVTFLDRTGITVIRPLVYLPEKIIVHMKNRLHLPVVPSACPYDGHTKRQEMKNLLRDFSKRYPHAPEYMLHALRNDRQYGLWDRKE